MLILESYYFIVYHLLCVYGYFHTCFYKDTRKRKLEILNKYIDKVIYINLEERKDRRISTESLLGKIFEKNKITRCNAIKSDCGAIGCTKSHIKCLEYAINNECKNILILEDDIDISKLKCPKLMLENVLN